MADKESRIDELIEQVRTLTAAGWDNERIIQCLFDAGASKGDATFALTRGGGVPRGDAIHIVHHNEAYEFRKATDADWNNALCDCLEDDGFIASLASTPDEPDQR
jgi:hypothetical protein